MTVKFSHERKVRSFAKKTLGSTRVGRAIRLPGGMLAEFGVEIGGLEGGCGLGWDWMEVAIVLLLWTAWTLIRSQ